MLFNEIKVRINGREKWVDSKKWFNQMLDEYNKVSYKGKNINPYDVRVKNFFDNIPEELLSEWGKAFPNVDISTECRKARVWLISNPQKSKKNFKSFVCNWLARAMQNGGTIPVQTDAKIEYQIKKRQEEYRVIQDREDCASQDEVKDILSQWKKKPLALKKEEDDE